MTLGQAIGEILPLAIGVAISPIPIMAVILMLFSPKAKVNGPAFLAGWLLGLIVLGVIVLSVSNAGDVDSNEDGSNVAALVKLGLGLLLLLLAVRQWRSRPKEGEEPKVPTWMQAIDTVTPVKALGLGALLSSINPKNLALAVGAALVIAQAGLSSGDTTIVYAIFVIVASLTIAGPVLYYLVGGEGAKKAMDSWKTWLTANNAAVMAVLLLVMGTSLLGKGISGLFD